MTYKQPLTPSIYRVSLWLLLLGCSILASGVYASSTPEDTSISQEELVEDAEKLFPGDEDQRNSFIRYVNLTVESLIHNYCDKIEAPSIEQERIIAKYKRRYPLNDNNAKVGQSSVDDSSDKETENKNKKLTGDSTTNEEIEEAKGMLKVSISGASIVGFFSVLFNYFGKKWRKPERPSKAEKSEGEEPIDDTQQNTQVRPKDESVPTQDSNEVEEDLQEQVPLHIHLLNPEALKSLIELAPAGLEQLGLDETKLNALLGIITSEQKEENKDALKDVINDLDQKGLSVLRHLQDENLNPENIDQLIAKILESVDISSKELESAQRDQETDPLTGQKGAQSQTSINENNNEATSKPDLKTEELLAANNLTNNNKSGENKGKRGLFNLGLFSKKKKKKPQTPNNAKNSDQETDSKNNRHIEEVQASIEESPSLNNENNYIAFTTKDTPDFNKHLEEVHPEEEIVFFENAHVLEKGETSALETRNSAEATTSNVTNNTHDITAILNAYNELTEEIKMPLLANKELLKIATENAPLFFNCNPAFLQKGGLNIDSLQRLANGEDLQLSDLPMLLQTAWFGKQKKGQLLEQEEVAQRFADMQQRIVDEYSKQSSGDTPLAPQELLKFTKYFTTIVLGGFFGKIMHNLQHLSFSSPFKWFGKNDQKKPIPASQTLGNKNLTSSTKPSSKNKPNGMLASLKKLFFGTQGTSVKTTGSGATNKLTSIPSVEMPASPATNNQKNGKTGRIRGAFKRFLYGPQGASVENAASSAINNQQKQVQTPKKKWWEWLRKREQSPANGVQDTRFANHKKNVLPAKKGNFVKALKWGIGLGIVGGSYYLYDRYLAKEKATAMPATPAGAQKKWMFFILFLLLGGLLVGGIFSRKKTPRA